MAINVEILMRRRQHMQEAEADPDRKAAWTPILHRYQQLADILRRRGISFLPNTTLLEQEKQGTHMAPWLRRKFRAYAAVSEQLDSQLADRAAERLEQIDQLAVPLIPGSGLGIVGARNRQGYGGVLTAMRIDQGLSQGALVKRMGVGNKGQVSLTEKESWIDPELTTIARYIVKGLGFDPSSIESRRVLVTLLRITAPVANTKLSPSRMRVDAELDVLAQDQRVQLNGEVNLGLYLRQVRLKRGLTQSQVYTQLGVIQPNFSRYEAGRGIPCLYRFLDWLNALGLHTTDLEAHVAWSIAMRQESNRVKLKGQKRV